MFMVGEQEHNEGCRFNILLAFVTPGYNRKNSTLGGSHWCQDYQVEARCKCKMPILFTVLSINKTVTEEHKHGTKHKQNNREHEQNKTEA